MNDKTAKAPPAEHFEVEDDARPKPLTPAAQRALAEAEARRKAAATRAANQAKEVGGRDGPEPTRYGDWEKDGLAKDF